MRLFPALGLLPVLLVPGGVRDRVEILERDVSNLKEDVLAMRQDQTAILLELEKLNQRLGVDRKEGMADLQVRLEAVDDDVRSLFENLNDLDARMRRMEERVDLAMRNIYRRPGGPVEPGESSEGSAEVGPTTPPMEEGEGRMEEPAQEGRDGRRARMASEGSDQPTPPGIAPAAGPATGEGEEEPEPQTPEVMVDPEELYQTAYTDFARGNYELAILGFQDYLKRFSETELADNALYWIGESHYSLGRYGQAVQSFTEVETRFPETDKVPDAMLKRGYALIELNRVDEGIRELQRLIAAHPRSNAARIARQRLRSMGLPSS